MKLLLDTNAYAALMRGDAQVAGYVRRAREIVFSAVVAGELLFGFRAGSRYQRNAADLGAFLENPYVKFLTVGHTTAERFALIAAALRKKGRPIPTNDIWIAAHATESGADLLTFDAHFAAIDGLAWVQLSA